MNFDGMFSTLEHLFCPDRILKAFYESSIMKRVNKDVTVSPSFSQSILS